MVGPRGPVPPLYSDLYSIMAKLDWNEMKYTSEHTGWLIRQNRSGVRRLAAVAKPFRAKRKTHSWQVR
jgi:hypothetical protein